MPSRPAGQVQGSLAWFTFDALTHTVFGSYAYAPGWTCRTVDTGDTVNDNKFNCSTYCTNPVPAIGVALKIAFSNTGKDLHVTAQGWGPRPEGAGAGIQEGSAAGSCSSGVDGIAKLPEVELLPQDMTSEKSKNDIVPITTTLAAAATAVTVGGAALYTRRKRSTR